VESKIWPTVSNKNENNGNSIRRHGDKEQYSRRSDRNGKIKKSKEKLHQQKYGTKHLRRSEQPKHWQQPKRQSELIAKHYPFRNFKNILKCQKYIVYNVKNILYRCIDLSKS
jgi:hypothetical protein